MIQVFCYCRNNLGDDMFLQTLVRRYSETKFYLYAAPRYTTQFRGEPNLRLCSNLSYKAFRVLEKFRKPAARRLRGKKTARMDAAVRIGGSVFIEKKQFDKDYFPEKNKNFFLLGANFGPFQTRTYFDNRKSRIRLARDCCFRDKYSYNLFCDMPNVRYAPDILFAYPYFPAYQSGDCIGISVIDIHGRNGLSVTSWKYEKIMTAICDYYAEQGRTVKLLGFCEEEGDAAAIRRIRSACHFPDKVIEKIYRGNIALFLEELNSCEVIYAARFHAMIIGWAMGKSVVPVIYSEKQTHVIEDIAFKGAAWNLMKDKTAPPQMLSAESGRLEMTLLKSLKVQAEKQFCGLDSFISKTTETECLED